jgi:hypothetical protein
MHGRSYPINRYPHSKHEKLIKQAGFNILDQIKVENNRGIKREKLRLPYSDLNTGDFITSSSLIIAQK